jgi:hypothetical protein
MEVQEIRRDRVDIEPTSKYTVFHGKENDNNE